MRDVLCKKGMVFAAIVLFIGAGVVPSISGNIEENQDNEISGQHDILWNQEFIKLFKRWSYTNYNKLEYQINSL